MDAVVVHGPFDARVVAEPDLDGSLEPREIQVRTLVTGLSTGTELTVYSGPFGIPFYAWPWGYPSPTGYLNVGRVVAIGQAVTEVSIGDVIYTLKPHRQEYRLSADELFWQVPAGLQPEIAVFAYLINLGLHALRRGRLVLGETVAVVGLGAIGLGAVMMARHSGCRVAGIDPIPARRVLATKLGAELTHDPGATDFADAAAAFAGEGGIDLAVETAGTWTALQTAQELVRTEGRISIVALHPGEARFNPLGEHFYEKQIELISTSFVPRQDYPPERVRFTLRRNCAAILSGLASGSLPYAAAVTQSVHYRELPELYERLAHGGVSDGAIWVNWD